MRLIEIPDDGIVRTYITTSEGTTVGERIINLSHLPGVDAVPVVRCKDCKHRADATEKGNYLCNRKMLGLVRPDDFCSFGERKDGEG